MFLVGLARSGAWSFSPEDDITARSFLLMDATSGRILLQKNPDLRLPPASTTKVLTAVVALESGRAQADRFTVSKQATRVPASKLYLQPGQTISMEDLLYAVLLASANDASVVLAEGVAGSVEDFAELMNKKAHEIGARNTHFTNPHGLTAPDHYSTARDLALIFRYAMKNPTFRQIVQTKIGSVRSVAGGRKKRKNRLISVRNHNRLLWNFDGAIGGKTGYTHAAQRCFVGAVERNGVTLIVSLLGSRNLWGDAKGLLEYGFDHYDSLKTARRSDGAAVAVSAAVERAAPREETLGAVDGYVVQVGSFRERERAEALVRQFSETGLEAFLEVTSLKEGDRTYRVRLGPYAGLREAHRAAYEVWQKIGYQAIVVPLSQPSGPRETRS
ncbi:MAG TPA: D-alanyl-D-alanine carboxypeptidase [candidate division Zixibacteria bacterium]|nr:D-alanyl-D-alanine carboxypeptidase [candidate division Zixibacteria bacterium]